MNSAASQSSSNEMDVTFLDTTGDGVPDTLIARRVVELDPLSGRPGRLRGVVETTALDIGIDGLPKQIHIRETVLSSTIAGTDDVVSTVEFDVDPRDTEIVHTMLTQSA
jgi:hypothetical protein